MFGAEPWMIRQSKTMTVPGGPMSGTMPDSFAASRTTSGGMSIVSGTKMCPRRCERGIIISGPLQGFTSSRNTPAMAIVGSSDDVTDALFDLRAAGITQFLFMGWPDMEEMAIFRDEVLPRVRAREMAEQRQAGQRG